MSGPGRRRSTLQRPPPGGERHPPTHLFFVATVGLTTDVHRIRVGGRRRGVRRQCKVSPPPAGAARVRSQRTLDSNRFLIQNSPHRGRPRPCGRRGRRREWRAKVPIVRLGRPPYVWMARPVAGAGRRRAHATHVIHQAIAPVAAGIGRGSWRRGHKGGGSRGTQYPEGADANHPAGGRRAAS